MSIIRPSNINKRLVGTATTAKGGSPGNAGQIGPIKTPYITNHKGGPLTATLGQCFCGIGCCSGIFRATESFCGIKEKCQCPSFNFGGNIICNAAGVRWIVAPSSSQVTRTQGAGVDANTRAQQVTGCTGWFVPTCGQLQNPGFSCRTFWDSISGTNYWSSSGRTPGDGWYINMGSGALSAGGSFQSNFVVCNKTVNALIRAFRCVTY